ncbi:uncharacterized protein C16C10.8 [Phymastichus coffea]|uniref:uncharacterized protein C16C10.8 n=1 Tax=Phymastichus coffea TaxID=108790 RepID=UPI00273B8918|nr:uncharacterized protein C16C10.8 [Phymastichus coffea]XP_058801201.1 uncharacterized protein C16C10.8 [Phymastichus coffea]
MVVFTCNNCGDSLQKPKVAKHYQFQCRTAPFLTCVDCFKDFRGNEYVAHTKCITENERYGGKNYIPKPSQNKGERKQQAWINVVQNVLANSTTLTVPERNLLSSIAKHENIPRKKAKFLNFINNISGNRVNMTIVSSVWDKMESAFKEASAQIDNEENNSEKNKEENQNNSNICKEDGTVVNKLNEIESQNQKSKTSKKRKHENYENDDNEHANKKKNETEKNNVTIEDVTENGDSKFSWKTTILEIVTSKGEITLRKLKKKVITQYLAHFPDSTSEKAMSKFEKKLGKVSDILIDENKVKLVTAS